MMPVYNTSEKLFRKSIESVIRQTYANWELLIIDDGSEAYIMDVVQSFNDPRIKYERNSSNRGISYSRNRALDLAGGKYLAVLDSDDRALPDRLEYCVNYMEQNPQVGFICGWYIVEDGLLRKRRRPDPRTNLPIMIWYTGPIQHNTVFFRRSLTGGELPVRYNEDFVVSEDNDLYFQIGRQTDMRVVPKFLTIYVRHPNSFGKRKNAIPASFNQHETDGRSRGDYGAYQFRAPVETMRRICFPTVPFLEMLDLIDSLDISWAPPESHIFYTKVLAYRVYRRVMVKPKGRLSKEEFERYKKSVHWQHLDLYRRTKVTFLYYLNKLKALSQ